MTPGALWLAAWSARRGLLWLLPAGLAFGLLYVLAPDAVHPASELGQLSREPVSGDSQRADGWALATLLFGVAFPYAAARAGHHWSCREGVWIGAGPLPRGWTFGAFLAGLAVASAIGATAAWVAIELGASASPALPRSLATLSHPAAVVRGAGDRIELPLPALPPGATRLRVRFATTLGRARDAGPTSYARLTLGVGDPVQARGFDRFAVDLPFDPANPPTSLGVEALDGAGCVLLGDSIEALGRTATPARASRSLAEHLALLLAAAAAVAFALGTHLRPAVAAALVVALWLAIWSSPARAVPGAGLWSALDRLGEGVAPAGPEPAALVVALALGGGSAALAHLGTRRRGVEP